MTRLLNALGVVTAMVFLGACVPAYKVPVARSADLSNITFVDMRSDAEKQGGSRSSLIFSCEYGITDLGENEIDPPRLEILKAYLQSDQDLQMQLQGKRIEVHSFKVIRNWQIPLRKMVQKNHNGALSNAMIAGCFAGPAIDGGYAVAENPNGLPSFTVLLNIGVDARHYKIKHFETANNFDETRSMVDSNILPRVLNNAMNKLGQAIMRAG